MTHRTLGVRSCIYGKRVLLVFLLAFLLVSAHIILVIITEKNGETNKVMIQFRYKTSLERCARIGK